MRKRRHIPLLALLMSLSFSYRPMAQLYNMVTYGLKYGLPEERFMVAVYSEAMFTGDVLWKQAISIRSRQCFLTLFFHQLPMKSQWNQYLCAHAENDE